MGARVAPALRDPVTLAVGALATYRVTRFLTRDELLRPLRDRLAVRNPSGRAAYLTTCPWCVGPYVAAGWALLTATAPGVAAPAGAALAWSAVAGLLSEVG